MFRMKNTTVQLRRGYLRILSGCQTFQDDVSIKHAVTYFGDLLSIEAPTNSPLLVKAFRRLATAKSTSLCQRIPLAELSHAATVFSQDATALCLNSQ